MFFCGNEPRHYQNETRSGHTPCREINIISCREGKNPDEQKWDKAGPAPRSPFPVHPQNRVYDPLAGGIQETERRDFPADREKTWAAGELPGEKLRSPQ